MPGAQWVVGRLLGYAVDVLTAGLTKCREEHGTLRIITCGEVGYIPWVAGRGRI